VDAVAVEVAAGAVVCAGGIHASITKPEFAAIVPGMSPAEVRAIIGSLGRKAYDAYRTRSYDIRHCTPSRVPAMVTLPRAEGRVHVTYPIWKPARLSR
jgi:hypothetical protein